jgi:hypothetical protein
MWKIKTLVWESSWKADKRWENMHLRKMVSLGVGSIGGDLAVLMFGLF